MAVMHKMYDHLKADISASENSVAILEKEAEELKKKLPKFYPRETLPKMASIALIILQLYLWIKNFKPVFGWIFDIICIFGLILIYVIINSLASLASFVLGYGVSWIFRQDNPYTASEALEIWSINSIPETFGRIKEVATFEQIKVFLIFSIPFIASILVRIIPWDSLPKTKKEKENDFIRNEYNKKIKELSDAKAEIKRLSAGTEGENKMYSVLSGLPDKYDVFQNLYVYFDGKKSETDFVVIGPNGIFVIETKNFNGNITGNASSEKLVKQKRNNKDEIYNPVKQVITHVHRIANRLRNEGYSVWVNGIVGFVGEGEVNINNDSDVQIFTPKNLYSLCSYITKVNTKAPISKETQNAISALLERECVLNSKK